VIIINLKKLYIAKAKLSDKVANHLATALNESSLTVLDIKACFLDVKPLKQLCNCIVSNKKLQELYLSGNIINKKIGEILCQSLEQNVILTTLTLRNCELSKQTLINLLKVLKRTKTTNIRVLDIALNPELANSDVVETLEDMLTTNHSLEDINLAACKLTGKLLHPVLAGLARNTSLKVLHLDANKIGKEVLKVAAAIKQPSGSQLEELTMRKSDISVKYMQEFFETLGPNNQLRRLVLEKNEGLEKADFNAHLKNCPNLVLKF